MNIKNLFFIFLSMPLLVSCTDEAKESASAKPESKFVERNVDARTYSQGKKLYQINCATCHGQQGEGAKDWRTPDANGKNQPPPLNGTGHTWHHSPAALIRVINNGTGKIGGNMPAWKEKLSNSEIKLILTWITSQWSDEIYTAWYNQYHQEN
mgnify:CR=1 FL=1